MLFRLLVALSTIALLAVDVQAAPPPQPRDDDVVAVVNGTSIYRSSVKAIVQGTVASQDSETPPDAATVRRLAGDALDSLIDFELLYQNSQVRGINIAEETIDEEINRTVSHFKSRAEFLSTLKSQGMTETDLRRDTRKSLAVNRLLEGEVFRDLSLGQELLETFYRENKEHFQHPAQTRASHILVRLSKQAGKPQKEAAHAKAAKLLEQLRGGADFAQLARAESEDPGSAALGGDLGYFASGDMDEAFEKAVASIQPGQLSPIVATPYGYHIVLVTDRRPAGIEPFDEVKDQIRAAVGKSERRKRQAAFCADLRKSATIQYPSTL